MSKESKISKADRRFAAGVLAEAKKIASQYHIVINFEDGEWYGHGLEMPLVFGDGPTAKTCIENTQEALIGAAAMMIEAGQAPPRPAKDGKRTEQVNVRLSAEEKAMLENKAKQRGFRGLSDFIRTTALAG